MEAEQKERSRRETGWRGREVREKNEGRRV